MINSESRALIVCDEIYGSVNIIRYFYFCKYVWNFKFIKITNKFEENFANLILIDRKCIDKFEISEKLKDYKFIICLWNGMFDYEQDDVRKFLESLKKYNIFYKCFLPVGIPEHEKNKEFCFPGKKLIINKNIKIISKLKYKFMFENPNIYYLLCSYKNPIRFFKNLFQKKIIFVGGGILSEEYISKFFKSSYQHEINLIVVEFYNFYKKNGIKSSLKFIKNLIESEKFLSFKSHKKLYLIHRIFRHILFSSLLNYKNFNYYLKEYKVGLVRSSLYRNNYYLDLGSTVGFGIYDRTLQFYKHYPNNTINLNFFDSKLDFITSLKKFENLINILENNSNKDISAIELKKLLII